MPNHTRSVWCASSLRVAQANHTRSVWFASSLRVAQANHTRSVWCTSLLARSASLHREAVHDCLCLAKKSQPAPRSGGAASVAKRSERAATLRSTYGTREACANHTRSVWCASACA